MNIITAVDNIVKEWSKNSLKTNGTEYTLEFKVRDKNYYINKKEFETKHIAEILFFEKSKKVHF